ncbi:MAG: ATP-binding protein [Caulobacteraceae bacterium]
MATRKARSADSRARVASARALTPAHALARIAEALERLVPAPSPSPPFAGARLFRHVPGPGSAAGRFIAAPDFALPLDLLLGIERQKRLMVENLRRFAAGHGTNHVLLWGVRGAGKSSLAKSAFMAAAAGADALRLVEVDRDETAALPDLFEQLRPLPFRFVVLCDDLSFEGGAVAAKALKSALEGGVAGPPENVLFIATSNRRHLVHRDVGEDHGPLVAQEDAEEAVSLSDRFGLWVGFPPMDQETFLAACRAYATRLGLAVSDLDARALAWAAQRGARSGRVAWQFIRDLAGEFGRRADY